MDPEDRPQSAGDDAVDAADGSREPPTDPGNESDTDAEEAVDTDAEETKAASTEALGAGTVVGERYERGPLERLRHDTEGPLMWIRELLASAMVVLLLGLLLFGVSGVWPPMVAVESGSMEPNMEVGDLVFVSEPGRFAPDAANNDIGVVTHETGQEIGYRTFGTYGSVVIYQPPGRTASPIIHRAMLHVEEGENWYDRADDRFHGAENCEQLRNCPAPHDGYITHGDNNPRYDQASGLAEPVRAEWVTGVARLRVPYLGYVRLLATGQAELGDLFVSQTLTDPGVNERRVDPDELAGLGPTVAAADASETEPGGGTGSERDPMNGTHTEPDDATRVEL